MLCATFTGCLLAVQGIHKSIPGNPRQYGRVVPLKKSPFTELIQWQEITIALRRAIVLLCNHHVMAPHHGFALCYTFGYAMNFLAENSQVYRLVPLEWHRSQNVACLVWQVGRHGSRTVDLHHLATPDGGIGWTWRSNSLLSRFSRLFTLVRSCDRGNFLVLNRKLRIHKQQCSLQEWPLFFFFFLF